MVIGISRILYQQPIPVCGVNIAMSLINNLNNENNEVALIVNKFELELISEALAELALVLKPGIRNPHLRSFDTEYYSPSYISTLDGLLEATKPFVSEDLAQSIMPATPKNVLVFANTTRTCRRKTNRIRQSPSRFPYEEEDDDTTDTN